MTDDIEARARKLAWNIAADAFGPGAARNAFAEDHIGVIADALRAEREPLEQKIAALEMLRPVWAQGYSSDSIAAQGSATALAQLWQMLGVTDQTAAVERLRFLLGERERALEEAVRSIPAGWTAAVYSTLPFGRGYTQACEESRAAIRALAKPQEDKP